MSATVHLIKLAVGAESIDTMRAYQAARLEKHGEVFHLTRSMPVRAAELLDGGSLYWIVKGVLTARQRLIDIVAVEPDEQGRRCKLVLDPELIEVERRPHRPFQGWRYLPAEAAPADRPAGSGDLPDELADELRRLGIL
jgi:hypothetical protein